MYSNKIKRALLCALVVYVGASHAMFCDPQHMVNLMVAHNELSPEQEKEVHAIFVEYEISMKPGWGYIVIPPEAVHALIPFIKNSNDPVMVDRLGVAVLGNEGDIVPLLVEKAKVSVDAVNKPLVSTAFYLAATNDPGSFDTMRYLLEKGAGINAPGSGQTPLACVIELGSGWLFNPPRIDRIKFLLEHGARIADINEEHEDVLAIAKKRAERKPDCSWEQEEFVGISNLIVEIEQQKKEGAALTWLLPGALNGLLSVVLYSEVGGFLNRFYGLQKTEL